MGRYNLAPARVHRSVTALLDANVISAPPPWYETIGSIPPAQILTRPQPVNHRGKLPKRLQNKKPSRMFLPQKIIYEEDKIRQNFFQDHPWELARPRVILEDDGKDGQKVDWSRIEQPGRQLNGESVVQRQLWLLKNEGLSSAEAYDKARHEFYEIRHRDEVELRIAKEEALAMGAYFGKSTMDVSMELEDREFEKWKSWASKKVEEEHNRSQSIYSGVPNLEEAVAEETEVDPYDELLAEDNDAPPKDKDEGS